MPDVIDSVGDAVNWKLETVVVHCKELKDYLEKYQERIKFMFYFEAYCPYLGVGPNQFLLVINVG